MFISFEGIDGSGKSTQASLIENELHLSGYEPLLVHEPGSTAISKVIRSILLDNKYDMSSVSELFLFEAARAQLVKEVIEPALENDRLVICDRFYDSTTAYQGGGRRAAGLDFIRSANTVATSGIVPDRTYFIDVDIETAFARRKGRAADRIEQSGMEFYERVRSAYLTIADTEPDRFKIVDGNLKPGEIRDYLMQDILAFLAENLRHPRF